jgi:hypothetical protein
MKKPECVMRSGEGILFERMSIGHPGRRLELPSDHPIEVDNEAH